MTPDEFRLIKFFSRKEVESTGAAIGDVQFETLKALDMFRALTKEPVKLIYNGLTSGKHKAIEHPQGLAVDFYTTMTDRQGAIEALLDVGFKGIGVYWNGKIFTYHADMRKYHKFWHGERIGNGWKYSKLI